MTFGRKLQIGASIAFLLSLADVLVWYFTDINTYSLVGIMGVIASCFFFEMGVKAHEEIMALEKADGNGT